MKDPKIETIDAISPSILNIYRKCPKKSAYFLDPDFNYLKKGSTSSSLGKIAHAVLAESYNLETEPDSKERLAWFNDTWNRHEKNEYIFLQDNWKPSIVPRPISWNRYYSVKTAIKFKVLKKDKRNIKSDFKQNNLVNFPIIEKYFINKEIGLKGKPDLIEKRDNLISIIDFKTGHLNEENKENYVFQLHLYLLLVEEELNIKVDKLYIFNNNYDDIPIDKSIISSSKKMIRDAFTKLQEKNYTASVSVENCQFCPFKIHCREFWLDSGKFKEPKPIALKARVIEIDEDVNDTFKNVKVEIIDSVPKNFIGTSKIYKLFKSINVAVNEIYYFTGNISLINEGNYELSWNSLVISAK